MHCYLLCCVRGYDPIFPGRNEHRRTNTESLCQTGNVSVWRQPEMHRQWVPLWDRRSVQSRNLFRFSGIAFHIDKYCSYCWFCVSFCHVIPWWFTFISRSSITPLKHCLLTSTLVYFQYHVIQFICNVQCK